MKSRRSWTDKEDEAFAKLTQESQPKNWSLIAKRLASDFGFKRRSGKQCRERWYNHLIPGISKKIWSKTQEDRLLQLHKIYGNKWTIIAQNMPGRTDNSIKNYFYSTVRRSLRRMGKLVGSKNSTSLMRAIKPSTLTHIFGVLSEEKTELFHQDLKESFTTLQNLKLSCQNVRDEIIQFSSYKPKRTDEIDGPQRARYEKVFNIIIKLNQVYQKFRGFQKNRKSQQQIFREDFKQMMKEDSQGDSIIDDSSQSEEQMDEDIHPIVITPKATRTRNIKIPQKISHQLAQNSIIESFTREKGSKQNQLSCIKQEHNQEQPIEKEPAIQQIQFPQNMDLQPLFQIQFKEDCNFNIAIHPYQNSPGCYFNIPSDQFNFFKSPLAPQPKFTNNFNFFQDAEDRGDNAEDQLQRKNDE